MIGSGAVRDLDLTGRELKNIDFKGCRGKRDIRRMHATECNFDGCDDVLRKAAAQLLFPQGDR